MILHEMAAWRRGGEKRCVRCDRNAQEFSVAFMRGEKTCKSSGREIGVRFNDENRFPMVAVVEISVAGGIDRGFTGAFQVNLSLSMIY